ncbi:hypothetical protein NQ318_020808 [Aromia moschata]|uniref:DUF229 domain containing protein n=1 Tax=Aromia moschata TaxID=1265417 RepID=A0AAV8XIY1_9CUCU|nr:hypothetical protein NQ318_020808 [Aromia moschata]
MALFIFLVISAALPFCFVAADEDFIINTSKCKLPNFPAFSEETNRTHVPQNYTACTNVELLTYTKVVNNTAYLHIKRDIELLYRSPDEELSCYYSYVTRNGSEEEPDIGVSISPALKFNTSMRLTGDIVKVECYNSYALVYENVHNPITISKTVDEKLKRFPRVNEDALPISVLLIVVDSVSRLNFARTMPKTRNFLLDNGFVEFPGYNKIDDNTFPNFNALLTGLNLKQSNSICVPTKVGKLDECPMIWYDFRRLGYVTAYGEDWAPVATYNYLKKGFKNPPADYYFKPYIEATETLNITEKEGLPYCAGPETEGERILHLARDFSLTFKNQPSFGIFWMNTFSHNNVSTPIVMDEKMSDFFKRIRDDGILNSSIVMFLSDHGMRFGDIRRTIQGWYEERLPILHVSLPERFKTRFPGKYDNLKKNSKKFTSTYDVYMTLQDVLSMSVKGYNVTPSMACPTCSSLFSDITEERSCEEAGVPEKWCTCVGRFNKDETIINGRRANAAAGLALSEITRNAQEYEFVYVSRILSASISSGSDSHGYYLVVFETSTWSVYQALFKIRREPFGFLKLIQILWIGYSYEQ